MTTPNELHLRAVINVDKEKCCNCHRCIAVCPVKLCNDGSGDFVTLNPDLFDRHNLKCFIKFVSVSVVCF